MTRAILDTSGCSAYFKGDQRVADFLDEAERVLLPIFALGELYAGFRKGTKFEMNMGFVRRLLAKPNVSVPEAGSDTAETYGRILSDLRGAGTPLPVNDVWIAAQAMEHGAIVVSYDRHFLKVPGLRIWPELEFSK